MSKDPYRILQIAQHAEPEVIEAAYRRLARKYHPDVNKSDDAKLRMQEINWAYEILKDPLKKARYDRTARQSTQSKQTSEKTSWGTPPPRYTSYTSSRSSSSDRPKRNYSARRETYTPPPKPPENWKTKTSKLIRNTMKVAFGIIGFALLVSWCGNGNGSNRSSPPRPTLRPTYTSISEDQQVSLSDEDAILGLLLLMIEDPRYDPSTSVLHKYLPYIEVDLSSTRITFTVWKDILDVEDFIDLGADLILFSSVVLDQSKMFDGSLTYIEVTNPGPQNTAATLFVSGRSDISSIGLGESSVYDVMETHIDWGEADLEPGNQIESSGCPNGCIAHKAGCDIKGNISIDTGEKIYHVPGQEYYYDTTIRPEYGERWFCTEQEALANGWRKAYK